MSRDELIAALREFAKKEKGKTLSDNKTLYDECRKFFTDNDILKIFDPTDPGKMASELEEIEVKKTENKDLESKALNSEQTKALIRELEEAEKKEKLDLKSNKEVEKFIERLQKKHPELARLEKRAMEKVVERVVEIETTEEVPTEVAAERVYVEKRLEETKPEKVSKTEIIKIAKEVVEVTKKEETLEGVAAKTVEVLKDNKINNKAFKEEIISVAKNETAVRIVEEEVEQITKQFVENLEKIVPEVSEKQKENIREIVKERVEAKILEPTQDINNQKAEVSEKTGKLEAKNESTLVAEINKELGIEIKAVEVEVQRTNKIVEVVIRTMQQETTLPAKNGESVVDTFRAQKLEGEVFGRMMETGSSVAEARDTAKFVKELNFPANEESTSVTEIAASQVLERNGFGSEPVALEEAKLIKNLIRSPVSIRENVKKISDLGDKLDGIKGLDGLKSITNKIKGSEGLLRKFELVQKVVNFQDKIAAFTGGISTQVGNLLGVESLKNFGIQLATRFGGEQVGNIAAQFVHFGFEKGITTGLQNVLGQIFATGTTTAVKAGATAAAEGVASAAGAAALDGAAAVTASTGIGIPIAAIMLGVQLGIGIIKKIGQNFEKTGDKILSFLSIGSVKTKAFLQDNLGKGFGTMMYYGGTVIGGLVLIPAMMGMIVAGAMLNVVMPAAFIGLFGIQTMTATQVSPLVAAKGIGGGGYCIKKSELEDTGGTANCDPNAPASDAPNVPKSKFVKVADMWRAGGGKNAEKCYYDVVCRARNAGVNPDFALWAWLHESGASNYDGFAPIEIEDFGIHGKAGVGKNNFTQQAGNFMPYASQSGGIQHCVGDPMITAAASGNDAYWLAIASWYLNGNCDPNTPNPTTGETGFDYLAELKTTWKFINSSGLPSSTYIAPESCGGGTNNATEETNANGDVYVCENASGDFLEGSMIPAEPIYDQSCSQSPAFCVVDYLTKNGAVSINRSNEAAAENLINKWTNAPAGFSKTVFNSAMKASTDAYDAFQCVGFAVAVNPRIAGSGWGGTVASWQQMIASGSSGCPRIENSGAGVGDFILYPSGSWYHIQVISKLASDGSYSISQANWGGPGMLSNVSGSNIQSYLSGKSVLRCK